MTEDPESEAPDLHSYYDCIIIGGGPAGLTCGILLGRYLRSVLIVDDGKPRNYASHGVHGFLGHQGILPADLLARGRAEAEEVGVEFCDCRASVIEKVGDVFEVNTGLGKPRARRVVLAYGVRDILPEFDNFHEFYGKSSFHCPDCDGYEIRGKRVGVYGWGKKVAGLALRLLQWTDQLVILTDGRERDLSPEELSKLHAESIPVRTEKVISLEGANGQLRSVVFESGEEVALDAMFFTIGIERRCLLAEDIGCEVFEHTACVHVNEYKETTIEGVYAIGDLVTGSQLVVTSAADGAIAAIAINKSLLPPSRQV